LTGWPAVRSLTPLSGLKKHDPNNKSRRSDAVNL
jgi:hypothetical protein